VEVLEDRLAPADLLAAGAGAGGGPQVQIYDPGTGQLTASFFAWPTSFTSGVRVAIGDVNGDGNPDLVVAAGPGGLPEVKVYDGQSLALIRDFYAFPTSFHGGVNLALGDLNGDGHYDIIVGADAGGRPEVKVFSGSDGSPLADFYAFPTSFSGGVRVAAGSLDKDGTADIVAAAGAGAAPQVSIFDGATLAQLNSFYAFSPNFSGGVNVSVADVDRDGSPEIIAGAGTGGGPQVSLFRGVTAQLTGSFFAFDPSFRGGVNVDAGRFGDRATPSILVAAGIGGGPEVSVFSGLDLHPITSFYAFNSAFTAGVSVAGTVVGFKTAFLPGQTQPVQSEVDALQRLGLFVKADSDHPLGQFVPVTAGSIPAGHVYFITHGWAPGYINWVQAEEARGVLPLWWWTQFPVPGDPTNNLIPGPSTPYMFGPTVTDDTYRDGIFGGEHVPPFQISPNGLAEQIILNDPGATVVAYSWIDDSATSTSYIGSVPEDAYKSEGLTALNGFRLAKAIEEALAPNFQAQGGIVHLIGHSHGSRVVTVAAYALQQAAAVDKKFDVVKQLTLLDSPEGLTDDDDAANFNWFYLGQLKISRDPLHNPGTLFVDNYISEFDTRYDNVTFSDSTQLPGLTPDLSQIVDFGTVNWPFNDTDITNQHEYAATWYAGTASIVGPLGFKWSPLLPNAPTNVPTYSTQSWTRDNYGPATQFAITVNQANPGPPTQTALFTPTALATSQTSQVKVSSFTLSSAQSQFAGILNFTSNTSGFAFRYLFSGPVNGSQLQLYVNGNPYASFVMTDIAATILPGSGSFIATIPVGYEATLSSTANVTFVLQPPPGAAVGSGPQVTVSEFETFSRPS
jgi:hypothetical protein